MTRRGTHTPSASAPGSDRAPALREYRSLALAVAGSSGGARSWEENLLRIARELGHRVGADAVEWSFWHGDIALGARVERGPEGDTWVAGTLPEEPASAVPRALDPHWAELLLRTEDDAGHLRIRRRTAPFSEEERLLLEIAGTAIAVSLVNQITRAALRERIKELSCLFEVTRIAERAARSFDEVLRGIAAALPAAWLHADVAAARITLDGATYDSHPDWRESARLAAEIRPRGERRGTVVVVYREPRPPQHEGPFLEEERRLLDAVALEISAIIERREIRAERAKLEEQIRHADRLATIGQLAAGVAHELNDPLGAILGFAELLGAEGALPAAARADVEKIVAASLHAREIVNKLRLFARQDPPKRQAVDLNEAISDGLYFTEAQCARQGVRIARDLDPDLPAIDADLGQMHQVLTNLSVNAMQAMPDGGVLTIRTRRREREVALIVEDTGVGIAPDALPRIFVPFFTTKPPEQGTGLGLSVVHGIVAGHGGAIEVDSAPGRGSVFEVRIPLDGRPLEGGG